MIRIPKAFVEWFKKPLSAPLQREQAGKRPPLSALTQNRLLGAHIAHAGRFTRGRR